MKPTERIAQAWNRFWFTPGDAADLALCRIGLCLVLLWLWQRYLFDVADFVEPGSLFWSPPGLLKLFLPQLSLHSLRILTTVCHVAVALSCIGLATRLSTATAFVSALLLHGTLQSYGKIWHQVTPTLAYLGAMALARSGDALSVDRLVLSRLGRARPLVPSGAYTWPVKLGQVVMIVPLFLAGVEKLRHSGFAWAYSDEFHNILVYNLSPCDIGLPHKMASPLIAHPQLGQLMATGSLVLELLAPLALFSRRAAWVLLPLTFGMLMGIKMTMTIFFSGVILGFVFWIPWRAIRTRGLALWKRARPTAP
jgi:hypothetical protein